MKRPLYDLPFHNQGTLNAIVWGVGFALLVIAVVALLTWVTL